MRYSKEKKLLKRVKIPILEINIDKLIMLISVGLSIMTINTLFFSDRNIFYLRQQIDIKDSLEKQVNQLGEENKRLSDQIEYLQSDSFYIEKKARENLGLIRENEDIYVLVDYKPIEPKRDEVEKDRWIDKVLSKYRQFKLKDE